MSNQLDLGQALDLTNLLDKSDEEKATQLPKPSGYRILCAIPEQEKTTEGGILKADITLHNEELLTTVLFVVDLGPDCYMDAAKFPTGPWCKKGDFVLIRPNAGSRLVAAQNLFWRMKKYNNATRIQAMVFAIFSFVFVDVGNEMINVS